MRLEITIEKIEIAIEGEFDFGVNNWVNHQREVNSVPYPTLQVGSLPLHNMDQNTSTEVKSKKLKGNK